MGNQASTLRQAAAEGDIAKIISLATPELINEQDQDEWTALHYAVLKCQAAVAKELIARGASIDMQDKAGRTPLHVGSVSGHERLITILCEAGANLTVTDDEGATALHKASGAGWLDAVRTLIMRGAALNAQTQDGFSALHLAAQAGKLQVMDVLIAAGASIELADSRGWRPLHCAAAGGHNQCVLLLMAHGAQIMAETKDGFTAGRLALHHRHTNVVQLLQPALLNTDFQLVDVPDPAPPPDPQQTAWPWTASRPAAPPVAPPAPSHAHPTATNSTTPPVPPPHISYPSHLGGPMPPPQPAHDAAAIVYPSMTGYLPSAPPLEVTDNPPAQSRGLTTVATASQATQPPSANQAPAAASQCIAPPLTISQIFGARPTDVVLDSGPPVAGPHHTVQPAAASVQRPPHAIVHPDSRPAPVDGQRSGSGVATEPDTTGRLSGSHDLDWGDVEEGEEEEGWGATTTATTTQQTTPQQHTTQQQTRQQQQQQQQPSAPQRQGGVWGLRIGHKTPQQTAQGVPRAAAAAARPSHPSSQQSQSAQPSQSGTADLDWGQQEVVWDGDDWGASRAAPQSSARAVTRQSSASQLPGAINPRDYDDDDYFDEEQDVLQSESQNQRHAEQAAATFDVDERIADLEARLDRRNGWIRGEGIKQVQGVDSDAVVAQQQMEISFLKQQLEQLRLRQQTTTAAESQHIYTFQELYSATNGFAASNLLGQGGYGTVYRGVLQYTPVAIKLLDPAGIHRKKQFEVEVDILSRVRHPHVLLLLGSCPDAGCVVYELMEGGSLEDCLKTDRAGMLTWALRLKICLDVSTALLHLHCSRPAPILHHDIKPANILLDSNLLAKLADVGLARLAPELSPHGGNKSTVLDSRPVGTLLYADPLYIQSGQYSRASDVYSLGVVFLQLLTGRADGSGVIQMVEEAIARQGGRGMADARMGTPANQDLLSFAHLGLQCTRYSRQQRPDLDSVIVPTLTKLYHNAIAELYNQSPPPKSAPEPPSVFVCPITQDVMQDPVVAADGYTYEREAIVTWLAKHNTSPLTNLPLSHQQVTPNFTLRSAITEWRESVVTRS